MALSVVTSAPGGGKSSAPGVVAASAAMKQVLALAGRSAARDSKVLITGESGVGKDLVARYIHASSPRAHRPFVAVNCAAFSETLLESELFGHVKGSFTGAYRDKPGKIQLADQGTIFMDEIGEMTPRMQALLLRFLESGEVQPVGADALNRRVDTRVIAATNRDLSAMAAAGQFRSDLMYRIRVIQIEVPALRHRREDVRPLVEHFFQRSGSTAVRLTSEAWVRLEAYDWPGNVREMQNVVEQLLSMCSHGSIDAGDLPDPFRRTDRIFGPGGRDRRRSVADHLFGELTSSSTLTFWTAVYEPFIERDLTRKDMRELIGRGLAATHGNYRDLVRLFRLQDHEYKRLMNFLVRHDCAVDYRPFRRRRQLAPSAAGDVVAGRGGGVPLALPGLTG